MKTEMRTKSGNLSRYAFACGYVQEAKNGAVIRENEHHCGFEVWGGSVDGWKTHRTLGAAWSDFRGAARMDFKNPSAANIAHELRRLSA